MVLIDVYNDGLDLLLVNDHDGKLGDSLNEWRRLDECYARGDVNEQDWTPVSDWLFTHGYAPIEFEQLGL